VDAGRLLRGRYDSAVGQELFSAIGEATLFAASTAYDSAPRTPAPTSPCLLTAEFALDSGGVRQLA
jgi:hypothetical protein